MPAVGRTSGFRKDVPSAPLRSKRERGPGTRRAGMGLGFISHGGRPRLQLGGGRAVREEDTQCLGSPWLRVATGEGPPVRCLCTGSPVPSLSGRCGKAVREQGLIYIRPRDFMYLRDFLSPILEAFFLTASVGRPSSAATSAVGRSENSLRSCFTSSLVHDPFV